MDEKEVRAGLNCGLDRAETGVNGGCDAVNVTAVFDLQTVYCAIPIIETLRFQQTIALLNNGRQGDRRHGFSESGGVRTCKVILCWRGSDSDRARGRCDDARRAAVGRDTSLAALRNHDERISVLFLAIRTGFHAAY